MTYFSISKYRTVLMGLAIAWIMYFHISVSTRSDFGWFFHRIGFYGVDIFLFLSGVGVYFSLKKRPNILRFYKARLKRILPAYLIVASAAYLLLRLENGSIENFLIYISGIGYWVRLTRFDWYIPTQMLFYLLAPLFLCFYNKLSEEKRGIYVASCISFTPLLCLMLYYLNCTYLWGSSVRLAIFLLGIHMGSRIEQNKKMTRADLYFAFAFFIVGLLSSFFIHKHPDSLAHIMDGLNAYPALLMMPSFCMLASLFFDKIAQKSDKALKIATFPFVVLGKHSLEIYLLHQQYQSIFPKYFNYSNQIIIVLATIASAVILRSLICSVERLISHIAAKIKKKELSSHV